MTPLTSSPPANQISFVMSCSFFSPGSGYRSFCLITRAALPHHANPVFRRQQVGAGGPAYSQFWGRRRLLVDIMWIIGVMKRAG